MEKILLTLAVYSLDLPEYACARLRLLGPAEALGGQVTVRWAARSNGRDYAISQEAMDGADLIIFQRYFPMQGTWPLVEEALGSGIPVVYETDDNFLAVPEDHPLRERLGPVEPFARELLARAFCVTVATAELKRAFAGLARRVEVLPNLVDESLWAGPGPVDQEPLKVVFAGTPTHGADLGQVAEGLAQVARRHPDKVRFIMLGCGEVPGLAAETLGFSFDYPDYAARLAGLRPDIGLAPLADNPFNRCKSAVKWLEYSALGAPGIYADLPPYGPVKHEVNGLKAGAEPGQWAQALERLVLDREFRLALGERARREVLGRFGLKAGAKAYLRLWQSIKDEWDERGRI
jgi:glycosyltransferase involved in cell wall biosynthesis